MPADMFEPFRLGELTLPNRVVMAPMTRNRADRDGVATQLMATYYVQRATAGLIIAESAPISAQAIGYPFTPGIHTDAQMAGWLRIANSVHSAGGRIFIQLQHCGRISHPSLQAEGALPVAPSALRPDGYAVTYEGMQDFVTPRALEHHEIAALVATFRDAAAKARQAGFDGIEVHGANGYIIDQFLRDGSNHRTDAYGGSIQNRMRFLNDVLDAVLTVWPAGRVGLRLTPENSFNSMSDSNPQTHFGYVLNELSARNLAYVHILEGDMATHRKTLNYPALRARYDGTYIANNGYDLARAQAALQVGDADLVAFGTPFLANPDLVRRFRELLPLNKSDPLTYYSGGEDGYADSPFYEDAEANAA